MIDVFYNASLTSQEVQHRVFYPDGHPSRYQSCPTELNFGEQTGTGVFPVVIAVPLKINTTAKCEPFITLKDHKPNFNNNPTCCLINPTKAEIGKMSKRILDCINTKVVHNLKLNQWKNTKAVLNWFNCIHCKASCSFIAFEVASQYVYISNDDRHIILKAKTSLLYSNGELWAKKTSSSLFDITMDSYDGAELCKPVGAYLLYPIKKEFRDMCDFGLYREALYHRQQKRSENGRSK